MSNTIRILILSESQPASEDLAEIFRSAGYSTLVHRITSAEDMVESLQEKVWDILLADEENPHEELSSQQVLEKLAELGKDLPVFRIVPDGDIKLAEDLAAGYAYTLKKPQHALLEKLAARETKAVNQRRELRLAKVNLQEATERLETLLEGTKDAIAYVADGIHINVNEAYAEVFGYEDLDDMDCMSLIDLVSSDDMEKVKMFMRHYQKQESEDENAESNISFVGVKEDGSEFPVSMSFSKATFDGEDCTQILIRAGSGEAGAGGGASAIENPETGAYTKDYMMNKLDALVKARTTATLLMIEVNNFDKLCQEHGYFAASIVTHDMAKQIKAKISDSQSLAHFNDRSMLLLLPEADEAKTTEFAHELCKLIEDHICQYGEHQTVQYTCSIGVLAITEGAARHAWELVNHSWAAADQAAPNSVNSFSIQKSAVTEEGGLDVDTAIEQDRFFLMYQPLINLRGEGGEQYEALVRMIDEEGQEISPGRFMSSIKDTKLDRWIILESLTSLAGHRANDHDTRMIINLSGNVMKDADFVNWAGTAIKAANIPYEAVWFQISEAEVAKNLTGAKALCDGLSALGCGFAINQFGRAEDPFKALKHVAPTFVKIDGSLTLALQDGTDDGKVKTLVSGLKEESMASIVPFVENAGLLATLWQLGVDYIQGDYLSGPMREMNYEFTEIA